MTKVSEAVRRETVYISLWSFIFSALMQAVFLLSGKWDLAVLFGNLLSVSVSILNFFLMGLSVQKAVQKDEKEAKDTLKLSQSLRMLMLFLAVGAGVYFPLFNDLSVLIPLIFPRIAIALSRFVRKEENSGEVCEK